MNASPSTVRAAAHASLFLGLGSALLWACSSGSPSAEHQPGQVGAINTPHASEPSAVQSIDASVGSVQPNAPAGTLADGSTRTPTAAVDPNADITPVMIDQTGPDNPAGLSSDEVRDLMAGGPLGDLAWLYPYDGTVFPRGMLAPIVMWNGSPDADAVYLHIQSQRFEYKGALKPSDVQNPYGATVITQIGNFVNSQRPATGRQLPIPQEIWDVAGQKTLGRSDPFTLEITERAHGKVRGRVSAQIWIAQGSLKGSVYYNTCSSSLEAADNVGEALSGGAKIIRIASNGTPQQLHLREPGSEQRGCVGCHTVSANGTQLIAQRSTSWKDILSLNPQPSAGISYPLRSDASPELVGNPVGPNAAYGALYPDGSKFLSTAVAPIITDSSDPRYLVWGVGLVVQYGGVSISSSAGADAVLYDSSDGSVVADTGIPPSAMLPAFSPDGTHLVFNDLAVDGGRALAVMDYDVHQDRASGYKLLVHERDASGEMRPGFPFFLPDNKAVVFVRTRSPTFTYLWTGTEAQESAGTKLFAATSDLFIADVATGKVTLLARAMGFDSPEDAERSQSYLPFPELDAHHNYFPTVSQVAAGGYYWVFFDTYRNFGNLGITRGIWGFAVDVRPDGYTVDSSHPPFYLPGQEFNAGNNHRAFIALDPCKGTGARCTSAVECCADDVCSLEGSTTTEHGLQVGKCAPPPATCAQVEEHCASAEDCCDTTNDCINGFCTLIELF